MSADDLVRARKAIALGVGHTTRENRVLPFAQSASAIPARVGSGASITPRQTAAVPACLSANWGYVSWAPETSLAWHATAAPLVSSDGVWSFNPTPQKRLTFETGQSHATNQIVHVNFSSPDTPGALYSGAAIGELQVLEMAYENREWYAQTVARIDFMGVFGGSQRLQSLLLKQDAYLFRWYFSKDGDAAEFGSEPICINRTIAEKGLSTRLFQSLTKSGMTSLRRLCNVTFKLSTNTGKLTGLSHYYGGTYDGTPGFLPPLKTPEYALFNGSGTADVNNVSDASRLQWVGNPYHGIVTSGAGCTRPGYSSFSMPGSPRYLLYGCTRYFKASTAPGEPSSDKLPANYASSGMQLLNDLVLADGTAYSPEQSGTMCLPSQWLHEGEDGVIRLLELAKTSSNNSSDTYQVLNWGKASVAATVGTSNLTASILGSFTVTTTDSFAAGYTANGTTTKRFATNDPDYQTHYTAKVSSDAWVSAGGYKMSTNYKVFVQASPNGRQIAVSRSIYLGLLYTSDSSMIGWYEDTDYAADYSYPCVNQASTILTVVTVPISGALVVGSPTDAFQWNKHKFFPDDLTATVTWEFVNSYYHGSTPDPAQNWFQIYHQPYTYSHTPYTREECIGYTWQTDGTLKLWTRTQDFVINSPVNTVCWSRRTYGFVEFDTGVPSTDPEPSPMYSGTFGVFPFYSTASSTPGTENFYTDCHLSDSTITDLTGGYQLATLVYRVTNNLFYVVGNRTTGPGTSVLEYRIVKDGGSVSVSDFFERFDVNRLYFSYDPRTGAIASSSSTFVSWV
jgi:hypothetical protein